MTYAAAPDALQGAVAAGILGCGSRDPGRVRDGGPLFAEVDAGRAGRQPGRCRAAPWCARWREAGRAIPGYGHPLHKARDPRVARLFEVAREAGTSLRFVAIAEAVEQAMPEIVGKDLRLNVSAAIPAVLLGAGFPLRALKGVPILARTASLIAHLIEEAASRSASRCPTRRRASWSTTAPGGLRSRAHDRRAERRAGARAGHLHHRPGLRHAAGRPGRRRDQDRAARHRRPVPRLPGRPLQPALPDLQPQQAQHHARHPAAGRARAAVRAGADGRCLHPELPPGRGAGAGRRRAAAARAQPAPDLLLDQRLRAATARRPRARATTRWRRPPAATSSCWSTRPTRAWSARPSPMRSPASTRPTACSARCTSAPAPAAAARSRSPCWRR